VDYIGGEGEGEGVAGWLVDTPFQRMLAGLSANSYSLVLVGTIIGIDIGLIAILIPRGCLRYD